MKAEKTIDKDQINEVLDILERMHPEAMCALDHGNVFELLVAVVLSAQTTDVSVNRVTPELFRKYPTPEALAGAGQDDVIDTIIDSYSRFYESARKDAALVAQREQLQQNKKATENLLKAIEMGIITETTKDRLLSLEAERKDLEESIRIAEEALERVTPDQVRFFLERFKSMDANNLDAQRQFIKTFIQEIYLYDDYMRILFNYYPFGERKICFSAVEAEESSGASDSYSDTSSPLFGSCTNPYIISIFAYGFVLTVPV